MTAERLPIRELLHRIAGVRLLVVGDYMLDRTISGMAGRISPEAPTPVVLVQETKEQLGGAGNVVRNIGSLGGRVWCAAVVGEDEPGKVLESRLETARGRAASLVIREPDRRTTIKTRVVAVQHGKASATGIPYGHQQMLRLDEETPHPISDATAAKILEFASSALGEVQAVVVSDYAKGAVTPALLQEILGLARSAGKPVFVDPKERDFQRYRGATVLTPNASEAEIALGIQIDPAAAATDARWEQSIQDRLAEWSLEALLVTRGSEGLSLVDRQGFHHFPTSAREVFDVTGAGDSVLAAFSMAVASGAGYSEAAQLGNTVGGIAVSKAGTAVVYPYEVERSLAWQLSSANEKIRTQDEMQEIATNLRGDQKRIVFTNGCFDLLHVGHMHLLREAKKQGDVLVVGLNSDQSVKRLKGDSRPIVGEADRAEAIAALESVDYLVVFDEPDPMELIRAIQPGVLVKGSDYSEADVVGGDYVKSYGGQTRLIPVRSGISTTNILERIRANGPDKNQ